MGSMQPREVVKVDLHTHSVISPDGCLGLTDYQRAIEEQKLDCIAVTDHNEIAFAVELQRTVGADKIIVGEEIMTSEGEMIGLFLTNRVKPQMSALETAQAIHRQGGLVYIPHPFETVRSGMSAKTLTAIADHVDIIEIHNGRAVFQNRSRLASEWSVTYAVPGAAASDAHGPAGWGKTYSVLADMPDRHNLVELLKGATYQRGFPGVRAMLYPKYNRLRKRFKTHA